MKRITLIIFAFCLAVFPPGISFGESDDAAAIMQQEGIDLSSPEATWSQFRRALTDGDFDLALICCCPEEGEKIFKYQKMGEEKTRRILQSMRSIEKVYEDGATAKYMLHRDLQGRSLTTFISFAKMNNQWKITKL